MSRAPSSPGPVLIHLRVRAAPGRRAELMAFLREATPFYERPGGIRMRLLESADDPDRFVEIVEYADGGAYARDQHRVASDPEMRGYLDRWRALLDGGAVEVETWLEVSERLR